MPRFAIYINTIWDYVSLEIVEWLAWMGGRIGKEDA
jgi:hypothetical protein